MPHDNGNKAVKASRISSRSIGRITLIHRDGSWAELPMQKLGCPRRPLVSHAPCPSRSRYPSQGEAGSLAEDAFIPPLDLSYLKDLKCAHRQEEPRSQTWRGLQRRLSEAVLARTGFKAKTSRCRCKTPLRRGIDGGMRDYLDGPDIREKMCANL